MMSPPTPISSKSEETRVQHSSISVADGEGSSKSLRCSPPSHQRLPVLESSSRGRRQASQGISVRREGGLGGDRVVSRQHVHQGRTLPQVFLQREPKFKVSPQQLRAEPGDGFLHEFQGAGARRHVIAAPLQNRARRRPTVHFEPNHTGTAACGQLRQRTHAARAEQTRGRIQRLPRQGCRLSCQSVHTRALRRRF